MLWKVKYVILLKKIYNIQTQKSKRESDKMFLFVVFYFGRIRKVLRENVNK